MIDFTTESCFNDFTATRNAERLGGSQLVTDRMQQQYRSLTTDVQNVPHPPRGDATGEIADALNRKMPKTARAGG